MNTAIAAKNFGTEYRPDLTKSYSMPQVTLNIPEEKMALFMETMVSLGFESVEVNHSGDLPEWKKQIFDEREKMYLSGRTKLTSWEDFQKELSDEEVE